MRLVFVFWVLGFGFNWMCCIYYGGLEYIIFDRNGGKQKYFLQKKIYL
jgi:hypothetical protein